jgi:hypothetical protein
MNRAELERKFGGNVGKRWPKEQTAAVLHAMWALERTNDISALLGQLASKT